METTIKVGDILAGTWGYSMRIPSFYRVTKVTPKRVKAIELEKYMVRSTDGGYFQQGYERPVEPYVIDERAKEVICTPDADGYVRIPIGYGSCMWAKVWDGQDIWADYMD